MPHSDQPKVMIVDDSPSEIQALLGALKGSFSTSVATSGTHALQRLLEIPSNELPHLIVLDINMPGMDGYETCEAIKQNNSLEHIDILFFSSNDSTEEITRGFDAGASDFITKPFKTELLLKKLNTALKSQQHKSKLSNTAKTANSIAMSAMRDSGDLGIILAFFKQCFKIKNLEELAQEITITLKQFGLNAAVLVYDVNNNALDSTDGSISELETTLLQRLKNNTQSSLHEHNNRLIVSKNGIALLIKNLPNNNDDACRLKDHLMTLMEGVTSKVQQLEALNNAKNENHQKIQQGVLSAHSNLKAIQQEQEGHKKHNLAILDTMLQDVEGSFFAMGLTDTQEEKLLGIMTRAASNAQDHLDNGLALDEQLANIIHNLSVIVMENTQR